MIILDTCAIIFDALTPERLTQRAKKTIDEAGEQRKLYCCGISLWEIAMLIQKKRCNPGVETQRFLDLALKARSIQLLSINTEIASISCSNIFKHEDPSDRLIAATAIYHRAKLITSDQKLADISGLEIIW